MPLICDDTNLERKMIIPYNRVSNHFPFLLPIVRNYNKNADENEKKSYQE